MSLKLFRYHYQLQKKFNKEILEEIQLRRLKEIISHAYLNVLFYHEKFEKANIKPEDMKTLDDLEKSH